MWKVLRAVFTVVALVAVSACATLTDFDPPRVTMDSLRVLPTEGQVPRFEIQLRVTNPNSQALDIAGVSYSLELLDRELLHGVTKDVPRIEGYGEGVITLQASVQMLQVLRLLASFGTQMDQPLDYRFLAKVDFNGLTPTQRVEERGEITLGK
jgi:LEA14-like dessication related protein